MKFLSAIIITLIICYPSAHSQFHVGALGGVNSNGFSGVPPLDSKYDSQTGFNTSLTFDFFVLEDFAVSLQPGFLQKGAQLIFTDFFDDESIDSTYTIKGQYITIPVLFKIFTASNYVYFIGGISFDKMNSITLTDDDGIEDDISEFIKDYDITMVFGIAFNYPLGDFNIFTEGRYNQGFVNINNTNVIREDTDEPVYIGDFKNFGYSLSIGFNYRLFDY